MSILHKFCTERGFRLYVFILDSISDEKRLSRLTSKQAEMKRCHFDIDTKQIFVFLPFKLLYVPGFPRKSLMIYQGYQQPRPAKQTCQVSCMYVIPNC